MAYIGKQPLVGNFVKLDTITTSATTTFNLTNGGVAYYPQSANNCLVSLNGILQAPTDSYTISGSTIIFSSALTTSDVIDFIIVLGDVLNIGTPSDGTVSFAKVTSNLITGATAETSIAGGDSVLIYDDSASALRKMTRTNFVAGVGGANTPAFSATGSTQSISNGTNTKIQFNSEIFDTDSCYDPTTNFRFTPTTAGKYLLLLNVRCRRTTDFNDLNISIRKNGVSVDRFQNNSSFHNESRILLTVLSANGSSDYFEAFIEQNSGETDTMDIFEFSGFKLIGV